LTNYRTLKSCVFCGICVVKLEILWSENLVEAWEHCYPCEFENILSHNSFTVIWCKKIFENSSYQKYIIKKIQLIQLRDLSFENWICYEKQNLLFVYKCFEKICTVISEKA